MVAELRSLVLCSATCMRRSSARAPCSHSRAIVSLRLRCGAPSSGIPAMDVIESSIGTSRTTWKVPRSRPSGSPTVRRRVRHRVLPRDLPRCAAASQGTVPRGWALQAVEEHASDFASKRAASPGICALCSDRPAVIVAPYDAELFGHWWFEGPEFLDLGDSKGGLRAARVAAFDAHGRHRQRG